MKTPIDENRRASSADKPEDESNNELFAQRARELFEDSVERIDAATLSKLNQARQAALAESSTPPAADWSRWMPATGLVAAVVIAVVMLRGPSGIDLPGDADDFEILLGQDDLEMIEELEFYSWIELADLDQSDNVG